MQYCKIFNKKQNIGPAAKEMNKDDYLKINKIQVYFI